MTQLKMILHRLPRPALLCEQHEKLLERVGCLQDLLRGGANPVTLGEIDPAHGSAGVEQEFSGSRDRLLAWTLRMEQIVAADDFSLRVRQERIGETLPAAVIARDLRGVDADGDWPDATHRKIA